MSSSGALKETVGWCWERRYRLDEIATEVWVNVRPGGRLHPSWFFEAKGHLAVELLLFAVILYLLTRKSFKPRKEKPLSKKEQEELIEEWVPEPLVPDTYANDGSKISTQLRNRKHKLQFKYDKPPVVKGKASSPFVQVGNKKLMNLVSTNFLNLANSERVEDSCEKALNKYGCGSCGPRGFYGTIDVHLELEKRIANFLGTEEAILYSYDISTPASAIPAFCKSGDVIVADAGVSYAVQSGLSLSRSKIKYFEHNNLEDLVRVLESVVEENKKTGASAAQRRFIVVEGLYMNYGDLAPLAEIVELKEKYQFRLILEESFALGVLGDSGKGSVEHHGLEVDKVDITLASLGNAIGSVGGICAGSRRVCDHQRLSGAGYVFSASLPPYLAAAAIESLNILEEEGRELVDTLKEKAKYFRKHLTSALEDIPGLTVAGGESRENEISPLIHLQLDGDEDREGGDIASIEKLQEVCKYAKKDGVFLSVAKQSFLDQYDGPASIKLSLNVEHTEDDLDRAVSIIKKAMEKVL